MDLEKKSVRLKKRSQFLHLASKGRKAPMPGLVMQALMREDAGPARIGYTVTKKVGNSVVRNRTRRRLREAMRHLESQNPLPSVDIVLIGRDKTRSRPFPDLVDDVKRALRKTGTLA